MFFHAKPKRGKMVPSSDSRAAGTVGHTGEDDDRGIVQADPERDGQAHIRGCDFRRSLALTPILECGKAVCETVAEAQVVEAIHREPGARDIDGIERRVRAGPGRCPGGFCGVRIPPILARELNIPVEKVTKKGPASELFTRRSKSLEAADT